MPDIKFMVIGNIAAHSGHIAKVDYDDIWQANYNENGWTYQQIEGPYGTCLGEYDTEAEADAHLAEWLECDAAKEGRYCYTHNPYPA